MTSERIVLELVKMDKSKRSHVLAKAIDLYFNMLLNIANDIYDSCIKDYYNGYVPTSYKRHGNIEGINLYKAIGNSYTNGWLGVNLDENKLEPYGKTRRSKVFDNVINGLRGTGLRKWQSEWPMEWSTSYPNSYSQYHIWGSYETTISGIFDDFCENGLGDTIDVFLQCVGKLI